MIKPVVLQFTCMHSTKCGAVEAYFAETARICAHRGYRTVIQYESEPKSAGYLEILQKFSAQVMVRPIALNVFGSFWGVYRVIRQVQPEIIHVHFAERFVKLWIPILGRLLGVKKIVCTVHNIPDYKGKTWVRHIYNRYDRIMAVSRCAQEGCLIGGVDSAKLVTHYWGIFGERKKSAEMRRQYREQFAISPDAIVLAIIAFDTPFKGLDILLKAVSLVTQEYPQLRLIQIGVDPEASNLPGLAQELNIVDKVYWAGILDEGWRLLNAADVYVQSSRFSEGLGLAIVEAMALSLPVVGTDVGGIPEAVIDEVTGIVTVANAESLAGAIKEMMNRKAQWAAMGAAGKARYFDIFEGSRSALKLVDQYYEISIDRK